MQVKSAGLQRRSLWIQEPRVLPCLVRVVSKNKRNAVKDAAVTVLHIVDDKVGARRSPLPCFFN